MIGWRALLGLVCLFPILSGGAAAACSVKGTTAFFFKTLWQPGGSYALTIEPEHLALRLEMPEGADGELNLRLKPQDALVLAEKGPLDAKHRERVGGLIALQDYRLVEGIVRQPGGAGLATRLIFSVMTLGDALQAFWHRRFALYDSKVVRDWKPGSQDYLHSISLELAVADREGKPCFLGALVETYRLGPEIRRVLLFQAIDARPSVQN